MRRRVDGPKLPSNDDYPSSASLSTAGRYIPEQVSTSGIGEERGAVAFLLFLLPKPSVKPNSVRQTDPRSFPFPQQAPRLPLSSSASRLTREYAEHQGDATACIRGTSRRPTQIQKQGR